MATFLNNPISPTSTFMEWRLATNKILAFLDLSTFIIDSIHKRVGINTPTPNYDLDVNGSINFSGSLYKNGVPFTSGSGAGVYLKGNNGSIGNPADRENIFRVNSNALHVSLTFDEDENACATGPISLDEGVVLTVDGNLVIL